MNWVHGARNEEVGDNTLIDGENECCLSITKTMITMSTQTTPTKGRPTHQEVHLRECDWQTLTMPGISGSIQYIGVPNFPALIEILRKSIKEANLDTTIVGRNKHNQLFASTKDRTRTDEASKVMVAIYCHTCKCDFFINILHNNIGTTVNKIKERFANDKHYIDIDNVKIITTFKNRFPGKMAKAYLEFYNKYMSNGYNAYHNKCKSVVDNDEWHKIMQNMYVNTRQHNKCNNEISSYTEDEDDGIVDEDILS